MDIVAVDTQVQQMLRELFCHALGEGGHQRAFTSLYAQLYLFHQVVYLVGAWAYLNHRVQQASRTYNLLYDNAFRTLQLVVSRGGTHIDGLWRELHEFLIFQRSIVHCCRQSESIFHQIHLAGPVTPIHGVNLWHAHMAFIYHQQIVFGEEVQQAVGARASSTSVEVPRIVLYSRTMPQFPDHLHIIGHTLIQSLCLVEESLFLEPVHACMQVRLYLVYGPEGALLARHEQIGRIDLIVLKLPQAHVAQRVYLLDAVHLVAPEGHSEYVVCIGQIDVHIVTLHAEVATIQVHVVPHIQTLHQSA